MFCQNCGVEVTPGSVFCQNCGAKAETGAGNLAAPANTASQPVYQQTPPPLPPQQPVYAQAPVVSQPVVYAAPPPPKKQKKHHTGLWIFLSILVMATAAVVVLLGKSLWLGPKDLGIKYTQKDFNNVMQAAGVHITADLGNGTSYDNIDIISGSDDATGYKSDKDKKTVKIEKLNYNDYNWEFSNYQKKTVTVSQEEATALLNEIAPPFSWLTEPQVAIQPDNSIKFSSALHIRNLIRDIFSAAYNSISDKIPFELPDKLNVYIEGKFSITNNVVGKPPTKVTTGIYTVPSEYLTDRNIESFVSYFIDFLAAFDLNLDVESLKVQDGKFVFVGTVPTEVKVTPKNAN